MFEWFSTASSWASRLKRARRSGSPATVSVRNLSATSRPSRVSRARQTSPIPPAPSGATSSYGPSREPGWSGMESAEYSPRTDLP